jgi:hypothetical protein
MKGPKNQDREEQSVDFDSGELFMRYFKDQSWPRLRPSALLTWSTLLTLRLSGLPIAQPSRREIMRASGIKGKNTVTRAFDELQAKGYIARLLPYSNNVQVTPWLLNREPMPHFISKGPAAGAGRSGRGGAGKKSLSDQEFIEEFIRCIVETGEQETAAGSAAGPDKGADGSGSGREQVRLGAPMGPDEGMDGSGRERGRVRLEAGTGPVSGGSGAGLVPGGDGQAPDKMELTAVGGEESGSGIGNGFSVFFAEETGDVGEGVGQGCDPHDGSGEGPGHGEAEGEGLDVVE